VSADGEASGEVTAALAAWSAGDRAALGRVLPQIYDELRALAAQHLRKERAGHTLQATALVNEAFLRLSGRERVHVEARVQFFAVAAQAMRRVLVDHARKRQAGKRGGREAPVPLTEVAAAELAATGIAASAAVDVLDVDAALTRLAALDERQARVVELRFFAGMEVEEIAAALDVSASTVRREWRMARAWLRMQLAGGGKMGAHG
jgi:RNA polymerase sigma factor (TIGR02999 family)